MDVMLKHKAYMGINEIFQSSQLDSNSHPRLRKELTDIYDKQVSKRGDFILEFLQCFATCAVIPNGNPSVERALDFAAGYLALHYQDQEDVLTAVLEFIFKHHSCKSQAVRFRCCEFINRILHSMDDQASLYDDSFEKITSTMLERLQDKVPSIRSQAVMALHRLQVPQDPACSIIKAFLFHMERDPSNDVRAKVVKHIAITPRTLPAVFGRIHDVSDMVKKEAYKTLSRLRVVKLSIKQRQKICEAGVGESSASVKSFVLKNLMPTWFKQADSDFLEFLKLLFVNTLADDVLATILLHMFKKEASSSLIETISSNILSKEKLIPIDQLTPENVIFWFHLIKYFAENENESERELVSNLLPELTKFSKYLKDFSLNVKKNDLKQEFIVIQLFKIASTFSFDDEMGREQLRIMCVNYLMHENVGKRAVPSVVKVFELLVPNVKERLVMMAEVISDIREPLQPSPFSSQSDVMEIPTDLAQLSCESNLSEDRVQKTDTETLVKCLTIIIEFFKAKDVCNVDATLLSLKDNFVVECFTNPNASVQNLAQDVLAFYCIWNLGIAKENFVKFVFQMSNEVTCCSALQSVVDILLVHGFHPFNVPNAPKNNVRKHTMSLNDLSSDPNLSPTQVFLVTLLTDLLESKNVEVRARAAQGLAKLMTAGHLNSPLVLARLILIWFSPESAKQPEILQPLGIFLSVFSTKVRGAGDIIANSIVPALKAIQDMSVDEGEEIDAMSVAKLFVSLIRNDVCPPPDNLKEKGSYHLRLANEACRELLIVNGCDSLVLAKILQMIDLQPEDAHCSGNLLLMVCRGIKKLGKFWDKKVLKSMQTFKAKLEEIKANVAREKEESSNVMPSIVEMDESAQGTPKSNSFVTTPDVSKSYNVNLSSSSKLPGVDNGISDAGNMIVDETIEDAEETLLEKATISPIQKPLLGSSAALSTRGKTVLVEGVVPESDNDTSDVDEASIPVGVVPESDEDSNASEREIPDSIISGVNTLVSSSDGEDEETDKTFGNSHSRITRSAMAQKEVKKKILNKEISKTKPKAGTVISSSDDEDVERRSTMKKPKFEKVKSSSKENIQDDKTKKQLRNARGRARIVTSSSDDKTLERSGIDCSDENSSEDSEMIIKNNSKLRTKSASGCKKVEVEKENTNNSRSKRIKRNIFSVL